MQAGQTRAGQMVLKSLPVLHLMFTVLEVAMAVMAKKLQAGHGLAPPEPNSDVRGAQSAPDPSPTLTDYGRLLLAEPCFGTLPRWAGIFPPAERRP